MAQNAGLNQGGGSVWAITEYDRPASCLSLASVGFAAVAQVALAAPSGDESTPAVQIR